MCLRRDPFVVAAAHASGGLPSPLPRRPRGLAATMLTKEYRLLLPLTPEEVRGVRAPSLGGP